MARHTAFIAYLKNKRMREDPENYWGNVPSEISAPPPSAQADEPREHTPEETEKEEIEAEKESEQGL